MRLLDQNRTAVVVLGGVALASALAGCSSGAADSSVAHGTYTDGTYTESADYQAPSGTETVDVTLTLAGNLITAVEVTGHATDPQAKIHQGEFAGGIAGVIVGKNLDEIKVDKVGGSSLTSGGFNAAVALIKADAAG